MNFLKQKNFILFCVILLAVILVGWAIVKNRMVQNQSIPSPSAVSPTPAVQVSSKNGMKTYRNEEYGFKLEYPEKYIIKKIKISRDSEVGVPEDKLEGYRYEKSVSPLFYLEFYSSSTVKNPEVEIAIYNANNLNINEWINYINKGVEQYLIYEGRYISDIEPISILEIESVKALSGCCMECVMNIFILKENKIYDLKQGGSISLPQECPNRFNERYGCCLQNEDVFNQILASFKFLKY